MVALAFLVLSGPAIAQTQGCELSRFRHPGLLTSLEDLDRVKAQIAAGKEPWKSAFEAMRHSGFAGLNYAPHPVSIVSEDINGSNPRGAMEENNDGFAAYAQVLMWYFTGDERYARNAVAILNAWSGLQTHQGGNWYLQAAWAGSVFPLSAELLRATYPKWDANDIAQFKSMLSRAFLPLLHNRMAYGNRELAVINAMMAIGVFNDDPAAFCEGINHYKSYLPSYIYLSSDGPEPIRPDYWLNSPGDAALLSLDKGLLAPGDNWIEASLSLTGVHDDRTALTKGTTQGLWYNPGGQLIDGLCGETGRDLSHTELAMISIGNAAEIAWHQGIDLYGPNATRLTAFLETTAGFRLGKPVPADLYKGKLNFTNMGQSYEIAYGHLKYVNGKSLPLTERLLKTALRPATLTTATTVTPAPPGVAASGVVGPAYLLSVWQTLTNARDE